MSFDMARRPTHERCSPQQRVLHSPSVQRDESGRRPRGSTTTKDRRPASDHAQDQVVVEDRKVVGNGLPPTAVLILKLFGHPLSHHVELVIFPGLRACDLKDNVVFHETFLLLFGSNGAEDEVCAGGANVAASGGGASPPCSPTSSSPRSSAATRTARAGRRRAASEAPATSSAAEKRGAPPAPPCAVLARHAAAAAPTDVSSSTDAAGASCPATLRSEDKRLSHGAHNAGERVRLPPLPPRPSTPSRQSATTEPRSPVAVAATARGRTDATRRGALPGSDSPGGMSLLAPQLPLRRDAPGAAARAGLGAAGPAAPHSGGPRGRRGPPAGAGRRPPDGAQPDRGDHRVGAALGAPAAGRRHGGARSARRLGHAQGRAGEVAEGEGGQPT